VVRDGWLDTRDIGYVTPNGFLHLSGRVLDVIMVDAHVRYAAPIERVLAGHRTSTRHMSWERRTSRPVRRSTRLWCPATVGPLIQTRCHRDSRRTRSRKRPHDITVIANVPLTPGGKPDKRPAP
jgi:fatty-acyl-CoA synthase